MAATTRTTRLRLAALAFAATLTAANANLLADAGHGNGSAVGEPGTKAHASRTVTITILDSLYEPKTVQVKKGETIRFVLENKGNLLHEFNIGTVRMHAEHQKEMMQMAEQGMLTPTGINYQMMNMAGGKESMAPMTHDDPNAVLIEPGKSEELVWKFSRNAKLEFACNIPGHYESGMKGKFKFRNF